MGRSPPTLIPFDPRREMDDLRAYLGPAFDESRLRQWEQQLDDEFAAIGDEEAFYRSSKGYLYNLAAFAITRTKLPYLRELTRHVPPPARLLDYGCGIGSDGLCLVEAGYTVAFADFDNPSTRYLRWRLERRGLEADVYDLDRERPRGSFDLAYAFDVIEHVDDPLAFLGTLERYASLVLVNLLEPDPGETPLHRELPIPELVDHAARRRLRHYRRYHRGRSHLLLYGTEPARGLWRLRSRTLRLRAALQR
jgi:hypothetical protein